MSYLCILILTVLLQSTTVSCIINGIKAVNSEFPSIVLIKFRDSFYCGASLLLPRYVVTSGICGQHEEKIDGVGVGFVDLFVPGTGTLLPIAGVDVHPDFIIGNTTAINDLALVRLKYPLEFTRTMAAIPIYERVPKNGTYCKTAGWGMVNPEILTKANVSKHWPNENVLRKSVQIIVNVQECQKLIDDTDFIKLDQMNHICTRGMEQEQGPSLGDFGGPLICDGQLAGIATHSLFAKNKYLYTVYTPVIRSERWIKKIIGEELLHVDEEAEDKKYRRPQDTLANRNKKNKFIEKDNQDYTAIINADRDFAIRFNVNFYLIAVVFVYYSLSF